MSKEAEAEALAMDYSPGAFNRGADALGTDAQPEALALGTQGAAHVHAPPTASVAAAPSKSNLPVLDLLHWSESPTPNPSRSRISATNDSSAFMNASDERPFIQPPIRSEVRTSQPAGGRSQIIFGCDGGQQFGAQCKKQGPNQKAAELSGHDIFKDEANIAIINNNNNNQNERIISAAKKREMLGNDIFSDSNPINEGRPRRARQPPGGDSNLKLC